jgi:hypothetical protein
VCWQQLCQAHVNSNSDYSVSTNSNFDWFSPAAGGRNRKFLADPGPLEYKDNPEHGLRLILTFRPNTSFLVPLDRCGRKKKK